MISAKGFLGFVSNYRFASPCVPFIAAREVAGAAPAMMGMVFYTYVAYKCGNILSDRTENEESV